MRTGRSNIPRVAGAAQSSSQTRRPRLARSPLEMMPFLITAY